MSANIGYVSLSKRIGDPNTTSRVIKKETKLIDIVDEDIAFSAWKGSARGPGGRCH
jgi:hypothetical protein